MPTYEFRCPNGHDFEKFYRSIAAAPAEIVCPVCGAEAARRVSGGTGLVFKGSGFYITDYGKDGKKDQKKPPTDAAGGGSSSSTKPESAPASPSTPKTGE